jgi:hypothetical protein
MLDVASGESSSPKYKLDPSNGNLGMKDGIEGSEPNTFGTNVSGRASVYDPVTYVEHGEEIN